MEEQAKHAALAFGLELLELDTLELCGERYRHSEGRKYWRYGTKETSILVGGARQRVNRMMNLNRYSDAQGGPSFFDTFLQ